MNELTLKDAIKELEELSTGNWVPYEYSPEEAKLILNHINNLQSKIDKAIEYIETLEIDDYDGNSYFIQDKNKKELFIEDIGNNILDILKEDK